MSGDEQRGAGGDLNAAMLRLETLLAVVAPTSAPLAELVRGFAVDRARASTPPVPLAIDAVAAAFSLRGFERDALLLALAVELDPRWARALALLDGRPPPSWPTAGDVWLLFARVHEVSRAEVVIALGADGHLARHGLIELLDDGPAADRAFRLAPALLPRLIPLTARPARSRPPRPDELVLPPAIRADLDRIVARVIASEPRALTVVVRGSRDSGRTAVARALATAAGWDVVTVAGERLLAPQAIPGLVRECVLDHAAAVIATPVPLPELQRLARGLPAPLVIVTEDASHLELATVTGRRTIELALAPLDFASQTALWRRYLPASPARDHARLAAHVRFGPGRVDELVRRVRDDDVALTADAILGASRVLDRGGVVLADRMACPYALEDLVVPTATRRELDLLWAWAGHGHTAFRAGGIGDRLRAREGIVALFAGPPGTGKTMAAQALAGHLGLTLLRVDLSRVVNKYIGETEKNLDQVFAEAEAVGAVLFFDEADALFGKRSEIKDAHDRYANTETGYLLQRLEAHRGIVLLATNLQRNLDDAFLRRIQVVAEFPLPGPEERVAIWQRHLDVTRCAPDVDLHNLAYAHALSGGEIKNAITAAVLLAAQAETPLSMVHLVLGVWRELRKNGRLVTPADFGAWSPIVAAYVGTETTT